MPPEPADARSAKLTAFLEAAKANGASDEFLVRLLAGRGFPEKKILEALAAHYERVTGAAIPQRAGAPGERARDAFLYLLSFSTLSTWTTGVGSLIFTLLDYYLPEPGQPAPSISEGFSGSLSSVLVAFPVYLLATRFTLRELGANPEKYESGVRKWLTYLALLAAAGIVTGDLIVALSYFLRGDFATRFLLKAITVLALAGGVFWYYMTTLRLEPSAHRRNKVFAAAAAVVVLASTSAGFLTLGSPMRQREALWDHRRIGDLRAIAREVRMQWTRSRIENRRLPDNLQTLAAELGAAPLNVTDPLTREPYEYRKRTEQAYELCAVFTAASERRARAGSVPPSPWDHPAGRACFVLDAARNVPD